MHPSQVLFQDSTPPVFLPACDHYAGSEKLMRKSMDIQGVLGPVFDITFDCEDGAAAGNEAGHATLVAQLLNSEQNRHKRIGVRVHDPSHPCFEQDLALILPTAADKLAYLVLPKIGGVRQLLAAIETVNRIAQPHTNSPIPLHVLIETHDALAEVQAIAALPQVECLSFGIMDFVSAHHGAIPAEAMRSPGQFSHPLVMRAKLEIAAACHRYGKVPSHNVCTSFNDTASVSGDAARALRECGYTRMWSIHPSQIEPIVRAMSAGSDEINEATAILCRARQNNWGPIQYNGRLHDRASYRYYWTVLKRAQFNQAALPAHALELL